MEKVTSYKTTDGYLFETEDEATKHQADLDFTEWYLKNPVPGNFVGTSVDVVVFKEYLTNNADKLRYLIEG